MKTVCKLNMCTGCNACTDVCSKSAISLLDTIRNLNAVINENQCIGCGACERVCQQIHPLKLNVPTAWFQGWTDEEESRAKSSSGGFAFHLMRQFVKDGGTVCSCIFKKGKFLYKFADKEEELEDFRGSKYVKSDPKGTYKNIQKLLKAGSSVLFVGLPCHVAGVKRYIGKNYENSLYTIDLICHGSPSVKLLSKFLMERGILIEELRNISFRQKNKFRMTSEAKERKNVISITPLGVRDRYTIGFLNGLFYTENCYSCPYAGIGRVSDITLGDSWGSELEMTKEGTKGISLALCQTNKGENLLKKSGVHLLGVDLDNAIKANHQLREPSIQPPQRELFFKMIDRGVKINVAIARCFPKTCIRQDVKALLIKLCLIKTGG